MAKICFDIEDALLEDLNKQAAKKQLNPDDLIEEYVLQGLKKEDEKMHSVNVPNDIMEKINSRCKELNCNPEKLIHSILFDYLKKVESIPVTIDREKMMMLVEHDNPDGDDVLDNLIRLGRQGWD